MTDTDIDPELIAWACEVSGISNPETVVTQALREFIARHEQRRMGDLFGTLDWDDSFDHKAERDRSKK